MKNESLVIALLMLGLFAAYRIYPQIQFTEHVITTNARNAISVFAIDMDDDNDIDVLSASLWDDKIAWYENDGNQNFATHIITTTADEAFSVYAIDLDRDDDIDVLSASRLDNKIAWYENNGNQNFTTHIIATDGWGPVSIYATDVDEDNNIDVLCAWDGDNKIVWYKNDGNQNFAPSTITDSAYGAFSVYAIDLDGDDDIDVLSASQVNDKIAWYENRGPTDVGKSDPPVVPAKFHLYNNHPNPFNPLTNIKYYIPKTGYVQLKITNLFGQEIRMLINEIQTSGYKTIIWDGTDDNGNKAGSGIYFYSLIFEGKKQTKKMLLIK